MASQNKTTVRSDAHRRSGRRPDEVMLEWAQTGLMEIPVRQGNYYFKEYFVIPPRMRIKIAAATAPYYAAKLAPAPVSAQAANYFRRVEDEVQHMARASVHRHEPPADKENGNVDVNPPQKKEPK